MEIIKINTSKENKELNETQFWLSTIKEDKIKIIRNTRNSFIIVTKNNNLLIYGRNNLKLVLQGEQQVEDFVKIENLKVGNIKYFDYTNYIMIIVNDRNELFYAGDFFSIFKKSIFTKYEFNEIIKLFCLNSDLLIVTTTNNSIYGIGYNLPKQIVVQQFTKITMNKNLQIKDIQCGNKKFCLLDNEGNIYENEEDYFYFKKVENLPFKIIKINYNNDSCFILNERNELFSKGYNLYGELGVGDIEFRREFTKVVIDCRINEFHKSFDRYNVISTIDNEIYVCGLNFSGIFGIDENLCEVKRTLWLKYYYLSNFTKLNKFKTNKKYIKVINMESDMVVFASDYKINNLQEEDNILGFKLWKPINFKLSDINIIIAL
ncbi:hypothetical protein ABK040_004903 [Willaertia magna]